MKQKYLKYVVQTYDSMQFSGLNNWSEFLNDLHSIIGTLNGSVDGQELTIKKILIHFRIKADDIETVLPVLVQTAGTWSDTQGIISGIDQEILDQSIDASFGYYPLSKNVKVLRQAPGDTTGIAEAHISEFTCEVPQHIVQLLNKEAETTRDQTISYGLVGWDGTTDLFLYVTSIVEIDFVKVRKGITIR